MTMICRKILMLLLVFAIPFSFLTACSIRKDQEKTFTFQGTVIYIAKVRDGYVVYLEEPALGPKLTPLWVDQEASLGEGVQSMLDSAKAGKKIRVTAGSATNELFSTYPVHPVKSMEIIE